MATKSGGAPKARPEFDAKLAAVDRIRPVSGVRSTVAGVRSTVSGVRSTVAGVRSSVAGVRSTVAGVRCTVKSLGQPVTNDRLTR